MDLVITITENSDNTESWLFNLHTLQIVECGDGIVKIFVNGQEPLVFENIKDVGVTLWK